MKTIVAGALILIAAGPALQTGRAGEPESVALQASPVAAFDVRAYGAKGDGKTLDTDAIDNIRIDTNRDGIDVDACRNVRISNATVNSPFDDGICLKSSYGLGSARPTENVTITDSQVSGYDEGTLLDGTFKRTVKYTRGPTGRIKFGTESNGGFKNITISNCVFEYSRSLAIEIRGRASDTVSVFHGV